MTLDPWRKIYNEKYYRAKELILSKKFQERVQQLKNGLESLGWPIPKGGFKKYPEYLDWRKKYRSFYLNQLKNQENENNPESLSKPYDDSLKDILQEFGIDPTDHDFYEFIEHYMFFEQENFATGLFSILWQRNEKTGKMELFIQLLGNTRKEDIIKHWDIISKQQKYLPDYKKRNKPWSTFERDNKIYEAYLELKKKRSGKRSSIKKSERAIDDELFSKFIPEYGELELQHIRAIVKRVKKFRGSRKEAV